MDPLKSPTISERRSRERGDGGGVLIGILDTTFNLVSFQRILIK